MRTDWLLCAWLLVMPHDERRVRDVAHHGTRQPSTHVVLERARSLRARGELDHAAQLLRGELPTLPAREQASAHGLLGRIALAHGELPAAREELARSVSLGRSHGLAHETADTAFALVYLEAELLRDLTRAKRVLAEAQALVREDAQGLARLAYYRALVAFHEHDVRGALRELSVAEARAERAELTSLLGHVRSLRAATLASAGRFDEALRVETHAVRGDEGDACARADAHANRGWLAWLALEARGQDGMAPSDTALAEVRRELLGADHAATACGDPQRARNAALNLGLAAVSAGDTRTASHELERARAFHDVADPTLHAWERELEGRLLLLRGRMHEARAAFARELLLAETVGDPEWIWRALVGVGRAQAGAGAWREAERSFARAEQQLEQLSTAMPLALSPSAFLAEREASARGLITARLALGEIEAAHQSAREAMARRLWTTGNGERIAALPAVERARLHAVWARYHALRADLEASAREAWQLSDEGLEAARRDRAGDLQALDALLDEARDLLGTARPVPQLACDEDTLALTYARTERGFVAFACDARGTRVHELGELDPATVHAASPSQLAALLLLPFAEALDAVTRVEVRASGVLADVDVHALPFRGEPLVRRAIVTYPQDLGEVPAAPARAAVVVGDPSQSLRAAADEAALAARMLSARGFAHVQTLHGDAASRESLLRALRGSDFLHYTGHAGSSEQGALDAHLALADGSLLRVGDVLALERVPQRVVLSACGTGSSSLDDVPSLSLAQAFLARGAREVIGTTRDVDDALARAITDALYTHDDEALRLPDALRHAQRTVHETSSGADWAAFRVWVR